MNEAKNNKNSTEQAVNYTDLLAEVKNTVAERHGYPDNIMGSRWDYAMMLTHRRKAQIQLYEEVLAELCLSCR